MSTHPCRISRDHLANYQYPLEKEVSMTDEMKADAKDMVVNALDKFDNYEHAARFVKDQMDRKFGAPWHCVIGEGFGYEVTYEQKHFLFMFHKGYIAIALFKSI